MPGFLFNHELDANELELARQKRLASGLPLLDMTCSNPTKHGFLFSAEILRSAAEDYWRVRRYEPDSKGFLGAREAISQYYLKRSPKLDISPEQIFITASTSEAYSLVFTLLADPGDNFLAPQVSYPLFDMLAETRRVELLPYKMEEHRNWAINEESIDLARNEHTRGVLLISPHNPSGHIIEEANTTLSSIGIPLICDEVFAEFTRTTHSAPPLGALFPEASVFHLNGISKFLALPDLKLGWIALNENAYIKFGQRLEILNDAFLSAHSLVQFMLPRLISEGRDFSQKMAAEINRRVNKTTALLEHSGHFKLPLPKGGTFVFPRLTRGIDEEELVLSLLNKGVFVHPGYFYGCQEGAHIMISCLLEENLLEEGIEKIVSFMEKTT